MSQESPVPDPAPARPQAQLYGLLAEYDGVMPLLEAARQVRDAGYTRWDTYTPIPIHGLDEAMGVRRTRLPWLVFGAGLSGGLLALLMQWWMNAVNYPYVSSGKPLFSLPAFVPIVFEVTILFSAISAFIGMLMFNKLPQLHHSCFRSRTFAGRATTDRFFVGIEAADRLFDLDKTRSLLAATGAVGVEAIEETGVEVIPQNVRRYAIPALVLLAAVAIVPPLLIARSRATPSGTRQALLIPDMVKQPKFLPQSFNPMFLDNRSMRPLGAGTVATDHAYLDSFLYRGIEGGQWATGFPLPLTAGLVERGQARFDIYCTPCHGWDGSGTGVVAVQGQARSGETWVMPANLTDAVVRERPNGHIFNTITNGIRTMPSYGDQIPPADRWAIVSYVRALELSQAAPETLVPAERRGELK
jgi:mono/diheme cytochrome c family protein